MDKKKTQNTCNAFACREWGCWHHPTLVQTSLQELAEDKAATYELEESCCHLPSSVRSTFLMAFSPDGTKVASTHGDHKIYICDIKTGRLLQTLEGHPRTPWCLAFHPSSNDILASGCLGGEVRVWDLHGGSEVWMAQQNTVIASLAFHPRDKVLAIATFNELHFWDWSRPTPFASCSTSSDKEKVRFVKFDPLGTRLITGISNLPVDNFQTRILDSWLAPYRLPTSQSIISQRRNILSRLMSMYRHLEGLEELSRLHERFDTSSPTEEDNLSRAREYARQVTSQIQTPGTSVQSELESSLNMPSSSTDASASTSDIFGPPGRSEEGPLGIGTSDDTWPHQDWGSNIWATLQHLRSMCSRLGRRMQQQQSDMEARVDPMTRTVSRGSETVTHRENSSNTQQGNSSEESGIVDTEQSNSAQVPFSLVNLLTRLQQSLQNLSTAALTSAMAQEQIMQVRIRISEILERLVNVSGYRARLTSLRDQIYEAAERMMHRGEDSSPSQRWDLAHCLWLVEMSLHLTRQMQRILAADYRLTQLHLNSSTPQASSSSSQSSASPNSSESQDTNTNASQTANQNNEAPCLSSSTNNSSNTTQPSSLRQQLLASLQQRRRLIEQRRQERQENLRRILSMPENAFSEQRQLLYVNTNPGLLNESPESGLLENSSSSMRIPRRLLFDEEPLSPEALARAVSVGAELRRFSDQMALSQIARFFDDRSPMLLTTHQETDGIQGGEFPGSRATASDRTSSNLDTNHNPMASANSRGLLRHRLARNYLRVDSNSNLSRRAGQSQQENNDTRESSDSSSEGGDDHLESRSFFYRRYRGRAETRSRSSLLRASEDVVFHIPEVHVDPSTSPPSEQSQTLPPSERPRSPPLPDILSGHDSSHLFSFGRMPSYLSVLNDTGFRPRLGAFLGINETTAQNLTHRIQAWDFSHCIIPDICDADANVVVPRCKIHNDASVDISRDGQLLVALVPMAGSFSHIVTLAIYSLNPKTLGHFLYSWNFGPNAISVSLSPLGRYLVVGLASSRLYLAATEREVVAQIFKLDPTGKSDALELIREINQQGGGQQPHISLNSVRWLPQSGQGLIYGTNRGALCICRPKAPQDEKTKREKSANSNSVPRSSLSGQQSENETVTALQMSSAATQTVHPQTHTTGTQTSNANDIAVRNSNSERPT